MNMHSLIKDVPLHLQMSKVNMDPPNTKWPCRLPTLQACDYEMGFNKSVFSCWRKWMLEYIIISWTTCSQPPDHQINQAESWELWASEPITFFSF